MALTSAQIALAATQFAQDNFVATNATANASTSQIQAALQALDNGMNTTLNAAVAAVGGTTLVVTALQQQITNSWPSATVQQQALLLIYWARKAAGL